MSERVTFVMEVQDLASAPLRNVKQEVEQAGRAVQASGRQAQAGGAGWATAGAATASAGASAKASAGLMTRAAGVARAAGAKIAGGFVAVGVAAQAAMTKVAQFSAAYQASMAKVSSTRVDIAALGIIAGLGAAAWAASKFEASMTQMTALVGTSKAELAAMEPVLISLASQYGTTAHAASEAMYFIQSAGVKGAAATDVLEASLKASAVGLGNAATIADLLTSAVNAYGETTLPAAKATDILVNAVKEGKVEADAMAASMGSVLPIASALGVGFDEVAAAMAAMSRTGTDAATGATQLRGILSKILKPSKQAATVLEEFGLSAEGLREQLRSEGLLATLVTLTDTLGGNQEATARVFDDIRALTGVMDLLGENADSTRAIFDSLSDSTGLLDDAFSATSETSAFQMKQAFSELSNEVMRVGQALLPVLTGIASGLGAVASALNVLPGWMKTVGVAALAFGAILLLVLPRILSIRAALMSTGFAATGFGRKLGVAASVAAGPWGVAMAGASLAFIYFADQAAKAEARVQSFQEMLKLTTGASEALAQGVADQLVQDISPDDWKRLEAYGITLAGVTRAIVAGGPELEAYRTKLRQISNETADTGGLMGFWMGSDKGTVNTLLNNMAGMSKDIDTARTANEAAADAQAAANDAMAGGARHADLMSGRYRNVAQAALGIEGGTNAVTMSVDRLEYAAEKAAEGVESLTRALAIADALLNQRAGVRGYHAAVDALTESIKENGKTLDVTTEKGRQNEAALDDIARSAIAAYTATDALGETVITNKAGFDQAIATYYEQARALGMSAGEALLLTGNMFGAGSAADVLANKKVNPTIKADTKQLTADLADAEAKLARLAAKSANPEIDPKVHDAQAKVDGLQGALDILDGTATNPKVGVDTTEAESAVGRVETRLNTLTSKTWRTTLYVDVVQRGDTGIGDTATSRAGRVAGGGSLGRTMARHAQINSTLGGGYKVTNLLIGGGGKGHGSGDHQAGRAVDVQGPRLGAYARAVREAGGFAEFHGQGRSRHVHAVMGDTASPRRVRGGGDVGAQQVGPFYFTGVTAQDRDQIEATVRQAIREADRSRRERGA